MLGGRYLNIYYVIFVGLYIKNIFQKKMPDNL